MFNRLGLKPQAVEHFQLDELFSTRKLMTAYLFDIQIFRHSKNFCVQAKKQLLNRYFSRPSSHPQDCGHVESPGFVDNLLQYSPDNQRHM